jgi:hypothetical protein
MAVGSRGGIARGRRERQKSKLVRVCWQPQNVEKTYNGLTPASHTFLNQIAGMSVCLMLSVT